MTKLEALKELYTSLGGAAADVADAETVVDVLNAISAKYDGEDDATLNADAIKNIADVAESIVPPEPETFEVDFDYKETPSNTLTATKTYDEIVAAFHAGQKITGTITYKDIATITLDILLWQSFTDDQGDEVIMIMGYDPSIGSTSGTDACIFYLTNNAVHVLGGIPSTLDPVPITPAE